MGLQKKAFTLAEVLITLGIIGVVAAMTLPVLTANYRKKESSARLKKFYTTFNEAIKLAEAEYGDRQYWYSDVAGVDLDEEGNPIMSSAQIDKWFQKYFSKFIVLKKKLNKSGTIVYYLNDGSAFQLGADDNVTSSRAITFFPGNPDKCGAMDYGKCKFYFLYQPVATTEDWKYHYKKGVEPCKWNWDGKVETLYNNCKRKNTQQTKSCTAIIQLNGWEIPKDYPYKVFY